MLTGLLLTALLMGLGGIAHCAAMCGAPCAAALPRGVPLLALVGRALAYMLLGLVASTGAGLLSRWGQQISMLQPLWIMLQLAAVLLGLWLLWTGYMPRQVNAWGQQAYHRVRSRLMGPGAPTWLRVAHPALPLLAGMIWAVMPCGLLYAALMVAALASEPWGGALVMLAFAVPSSFGVWAAPALFKWLGRFQQRTSAEGRGPGPLAGAAVAPILWFQSRDVAKPDVKPPVQGAGTPSTLIDPRWAVRLAGLSLALIAAWAVSHQLVAQWQAWCA